MTVERIVVGPLQTNCYILFDEQSLDAAIIDPGDEAGRIMKFIVGKGLKVSYIICTHGHFDHVGAISEVRRETGAKVLINREDLEIYEAARDQAAFWEYEVEQPPEPDSFVVEGDQIVVGKLNLKVMHTPGHSPGGICLYSEGLVMSGDTIFAGSVGRTDFYGGDLEALKRSFRTVINLPPETRILPGHGETSTVGIERHSNFFVGEI